MPGRKEFKSTPEPLSPPHTTKRERKKKKKKKRRKKQPKKSQPLLLYVCKATLSLTFQILPSMLLGNGYAWHASMDTSEMSSCKSSQLPEEEKQR